MSTEMIHVKVLWDYKSSEENELSLLKDELIRVVEKHNADWWEGVNVNGQQGLFPANHVEEIDGEVFYTACEDLKTNGSNEAIVETISEERSPSMASVTSNPESQSSSTSPGSKQSSQRSDNFQELTKLSELSINMSSDELEKEESVPESSINEALVPPPLPPRDQPLQHDASNALLKKGPLFRQVSKHDAFPSFGKNWKTSYVALYKDGCLRVYKDDKVS
jgi:hypothetical protein